MTRIPQLQCRPLECSECGYIMRGLQRPVCPECGARFDPSVCGSYLSPSVGFGPCVVAVVTAAVSLLASMYFAYVYEYTRALGGWCGTARASAFADLTNAGATILVVLCIAALLSFRNRRGYRVARCAALTAALGWLVCIYIVRGVV